MGYFAALCTETWGFDSVVSGSRFKQGVRLTVEDGQLKS